MTYKTGETLVVDQDHLHVVIDNNSEKILNTIELYTSITPNRYQVPVLNSDHRVLDTIDYVGLLPSICLQVDSPTHTFIAKDYIVTHNTEIGALWLRTMISLDKDPESNYLITSPTYRLLNQSLLPKFWKYFTGLGEHRVGDSTYKLHDGRTIFIRSLNNPNAIEGIPKCKFSWNDECGMLSNRAWYNVESRLATAGGRAFNSSTPYSLGNWYHDAYLDWKRGNASDWDWIVWKSLDNPYIKHDEIEKLRTRLPKNIFSMKYEASFESPMGLVYTLTTDNYCNPFKLHGNFKTYVGLDFGFSISSTAIVIIAEMEDIVYVIYEFKRTHVTIGDLIEQLKQLKVMYQYSDIWCDSAAPQLINELCLAGLPARGATKGPGSVDAGISIVQNMLTQKKLKIFNNLNLIEQEFMSYAWDEKTIGMKPTVVKSNDDLCFGGDTIVQFEGLQDVACTGEQEVVKAWFSTGDSVIVTPNHKYITQRGKIPLKNLSFYDIMSISYTKRSIAWEVTTGLYLLSLTVKNTIVTLMHRKGHTEFTTKEAGTACTMKCGNIITAPFLPACASIIKMKTLRIILWVTLSCYQSLTMVSSLIRNGTLTVVLFRSKNISRISDLLPKSGTLQKRVDSGIAITIKTIVQTFMLRLTAFVKNAVNRIRQQLVRTDFVQVHVGLNGDVNLDSMTLNKTAPYVGKFLLRIGLNLLKRAQENAVVLSAVGTVKQKTYNLTTESHQYFANNILVSNCDALSYVLRSYGGAHYRMPDLSHLGRTHLDNANMDAKRMEATEGEYQMV